MRTQIIQLAVAAALAATGISQDQRPQPPSKPAAAEQPELRGRGDDQGLHLGRPADGKRGEDGEGKDRKDRKDRTDGEATDSKDRKDGEGKDRKVGEGRDRKDGEGRDRAGLGRHLFQLIDRDGNGDLSKIEVHEFRQAMEQVLREAQERQKEREQKLREAAREGEKERREEGQRDGKQNQARPRDTLPGPSRAGTTGGRQ
jgi:hypothetical protein